MAGLPRIRYSWRTLIVVTVAAGCVIGLVARWRARRWAAENVHDAAASGDVGRLRRCLGLDGDLIDSRDGRGCTPLMLAVRRRRADAARELVAAGADVNVADESGAGPLLYAACSVLKLPQTQGGPPEPEFFFSGTGSREITELLLDHGADLDLKHRSGKTPLHHVVGAGAKEMAELMLERGADPRARDSQGRTPLHEAHRTALIELLVGRGADVNARGAAGATPLWVRVRKMCQVDDAASLVEALLAKGADPDLAGPEGATPLALAISIVGTMVESSYSSKEHYRKEMMRIATLLLGAGADPNLRDADERTPLDLGEAHGLGEAVALLRKHGAKTSEELDREK